MTTPARTLPLSFDDAREVAADLLGPAFVVLSDGYVSKDGKTYLIRYEERDGPSWDLDILTIESATGTSTLIPWQLGVGLPNRMDPISAASA